jgi:hypothetical protein
MTRFWFALLIVGAMAIAVAGIGGNDVGGGKPALTAAMISLHPGNVNAGG